MEYYNQPSIDAILSSPSYDIDTVQSATDTHFQDDRTYIRPRSSISSRSSTTASYHNGLRSTPLTVTSSQPRSKDRIRRTTLTMPPETSALRTSYPLKSSYSSSDDYVTDSPGSASTFSMICSSPSLVSTPITPPTPRSPLLPNFPDLNLSVTIYKDIPFSPTVSTFTDCPFYYYREDIPPSKTHEQLRLSTEILSAISKAPVATVEADLERQDSDDEGTIIFDYDSDDELEDGDTNHQHEAAPPVDDPPMPATELPTRARDIALPERSISDRRQSTVQIDSTIKKWYENKSLVAQLQELEGTYKTLKRRQRMSMEETIGLPYSTFGVDLLQEGDRRSCV